MTNGENNEVLHLKYMLKLTRRFFRIGRNYGVGLEKKAFWQ